MLEFTVVVVSLTQAAHSVVAPPLLVDNASNEQLASVRIDDHLGLSTLPDGEVLELLFGIGHEGVCQAGPSGKGRHVPRSHCHALLASQERSPTPEHHEDLL